MANHAEGDQQELYSDWGFKIILIQTILDEGWIEADDPQLTVKRQALGATFGSALAGYYEGLRWSVVEDEEGRELCLRYRETSILLFPLTMISKRLENGEAVDAKGMMAGICNRLDEIRGEAS
ncbi:MAG: DUF3806 domain-containing protein [Pseudomonadota bacterium]